MHYEFQQGPASKRKSGEEGGDPIQAEADFRQLHAQFGPARPTVRQAREALQCSNNRASRAVRHYDVAPGTTSAMHSATQ
jgi:hypothetical protein